MIRKRVWVGILSAAVLFGALPALGVAAPPMQTAAPLQNPGFEGLSCRAGSVSPECLDNWTRDTFDGVARDSIYTPQGWVSWWRTGGSFGQPEVRVIPKTGNYVGELTRIRSGYYATQVFIAYYTMDAGLFQTVSGLTPGATVQFSAYGMGWSCDSDTGAPKFGYSCGDMWNLIFQVGIEPNGGRDFNSASVVWSTEQTSPDAFNLIGPVTAQVGPGGSVTVFLRAKTKWGYKYQEAYWDDASLVYTGQPAATVAATVAAATVPSVPAGQPTIVAGSDGLNVRSGPGTNFAVLAHVNPGTQFRVTGKYADWWQIDYNGTPAWAYSGVVTAYNTGSVPQVVPPASPAPTGAAPTPVPPTLTPTPQAEAVLPTETPISEAAPAATATTAPAGASICVLVYHDRNGDTFRNDAATEELLPNAEIAVADASGVIARYTTDGISEPHCFPVAAGNYRAIQTSPPGYVPSGSAEQTAAVAEGASVTLQFGNVRGQIPAATATAEAAPTGEEDAGTSRGSTTRIFSTIATISGVLVLLLAAGIAVLFLLSQRRR